MKKLIVLAFCLVLPSCVTYQNPLTQSRMDALTASWGTALVVAANYRDACDQRLIPPSCRPIVIRIQQAAIPAQAAYKRAVEFSKNPAISQQDLVQAASDAVNDFKVLQMTLGVK